jgi:hypothetical protein
LSFPSPPLPSPPRLSAGGLSNTAGGPFYFLHIHGRLYIRALRTSHFALRRPPGAFLIFHLHWPFYISPSLAFLYFTFTGFLIFHLPRLKHTPSSLIYISPSPAFTDGREPNLYFTFPGLFIRPGAKFIFHLPRPPCTWQAGSREPGAGSRESGALPLLAFWCSQDKPKWFKW